MFPKLTRSRHASCILLRSVMSKYRVGRQIKKYGKSVLARLSWFLESFHILSNFQGLSNLLKLLAARLNELETSLI